MKKMFTKQVDGKPTPTPHKPHTPETRAKIGAKAKARKADASKPSKPRRFEVEEVLQTSKGPIISRPGIYLFCLYGTLRLDPNVEVRVIREIVS